MKIIGLTGGIGSGKSTVLELFGALGATTYVADLEAKKLMNSDEELKSQIKKLFGDNAYVKDELNRTYIASIVFGNEEKLNALNALVHPKVREDFQHYIKETNADFVIYEAAILFESGSDKFCDYIITVLSGFEDKISRIMKRDKTSREQILERMKHQSTDDLNIKNSNFIIRNKNFEDTKNQVLTIFEIINALENK